MWLHTFVLYPPLEHRWEYGFTMKVFEYLSLTEETGKVDKLNEFAKEGWRVISVNPAKVVIQSHDNITTYFTFVLEREIDK